MDAATSLTSLDGSVVFSDSTVVTIAAGTASTPDPEAFELVPTARGFDVVGTQHVGAAELDAASFVELTFRTTHALPSATASFGVTGVYEAFVGSGGNDGGLSARLALSDVGSGSPLGPSQIIGSLAGLPSGVEVTLSGSPQAVPGAFDAELRASVSGPSGPIPEEFAGGTISRFGFVVVAEPGTAGLTLLGLVTLAARRRRPAGGRRRRSRRRSTACAGR